MLPVSPFQKQLKVCSSDSLPFKRPLLTGEARVQGAPRKGKAPNFSWALG